MSYHCYVFESESAVIQSVERYKQLGGNTVDIKILIKNIENGQLLSASGIHHVDYLYEITAANHVSSDEEGQSHQPHYFVGVTTGQYNPGVVSGAFGENQTNAMEALTAYGLSSERAADALKALRAGHFLVFVPNDELNELNDRSHRLHEALSASFGEHDHKTTENVNAAYFTGASYTI